MGKIKDIWVELFKLRQTLLLVLSGVFAYLIASKGAIDLKQLSLIILSLYLSVSGTTGLNMYLDRDIDSVMFRTMNRPLPRKRISEIEALSYSLPVLIAGVVLAVFVDTWFLIADVIGVSVDIILYTYLLKRRTIFNIVLGSIAGGMPAFGGWCAYSGEPEVGAILLSLIVALWAMLHIWYISTYYSDDYRRAGVPMLPIVYGYRFSGKISIIVSSLIFLLVIALYLIGVAGNATLLLTIFMTALLYYLEARFVATESRELARKIYKYLNIYLGIILLIMTLEAIIS
jgi:protoheme IX farnesyltransferase